MPVRPCRHAALIGLLVATAAVPALAQTGYYRQPAVHEQTLVFSAEGDLWRAGAGGGTAMRLTTHPAQESGPAISPDGRWIAFSANYDAATEAYVMPIDGGAPKRLSFEGGRVSVQGWTPRGEVLYATDNASGPSWHVVLRAVDPTTLARREIPLADAGQGVHAEDGSLYFVRFGLQRTGDNARGYRGGAMSQLWRWREGEPEATRLAADHAGNLSSPMWWQGRVYALSDADGVANLWSFAGDGSDPRQHTRHADFEVRGPSLGQGRIVYQHGADLRLFDIASGADRALPVRLASDLAPQRERWLRDPLNYLHAASFAPKGDRVALTARGQVALAGVGELRRIELSLPPGSRAREATPSPDGRWVYAISDASGEHEIWRFPADGSVGAEQLTRDGATQRERLAPSPDGKWLAHSDKRGVLWLLDLGSGRNAAIDDSRGEGIAEFAWSADSQALAIVRADTAARRNQLLLHTLADRRTRVLTSDRYESFSPAFSPDGRWLYFLSNRHFEASPGAPWGDRNLGPGFPRRTQVYALALQPGNRFPFQPRDELAPARGEGNGNGNGESKGVAAIQAEGLAQRLHELPLAAGNFRRLALNDKHLYFIDGSDLKSLPISADPPKVETFMAGVRDFALSADGKQLWLLKTAREGTGDMHIVPAAAKAPTGEDLARTRVRVGDWRLAVNPAQEWRQMFADAWRMHRDHLFDPAMRGTDWPALREKYAPLLARVTDRTELDDVLAQMIGELGVLHSQIRPGETRSDPERAVPAFLGARFERVPEGARIAHVFRTDPELPRQRAPLAQPGVELREGDVITAVNGRRVADVADIAELLHHQAGQQVRIDYRRGNATGTVVATPVNAERDAFLRYSDWVHGRREAVERAGDGRIGYLHLRAMGPGDIADFAREFYANIDREGLVIDVRRNRGGNIDSWIIEKLLRRAWSFWQPPGRAPYWNMQQTFRGHLVVLTDALTYSDGETFSAGVKSLGLGPLIGQRTAGAGVWLSDRNRLVDGGVARAAETAQFGPDGRWLIEGLGVAPDIEVDNLPHATWRGGDAQLDAALAQLKRRMAEAPVVQPPAAPIRPAPQAADDVGR